jgi:hypothetical protein
MIQFFIYQFSHVVPKVGISQDDVGKSSYKTNRKEKNLRILLHVDEPLKFINQIWQFQKKKARNLLKFSKNLGDFRKHSFKSDGFFGNFLKNSLTILFGKFF